MSPILENQLEEKPEGFKKIITLIKNNPELTSYIVSQNKSSINNFGKVAKIIVKIPKQSQSISILLQDEYVLSLIDDGWWVAAIIKDYPESGNLLLRNQKLLNLIDNIWQVKWILEADPQLENILRKDSRTLALINDLDAQLVACSNHPSISVYK